MKKLTFKHNNSNSIANVFRQCFLHKLPLTSKHYTSNSRIIINIKRKAQLRILKTKENTNLLINGNYNYKQGHGWRSHFIIARSSCYIV